MSPTCEILITANTSTRGTEMLRAMEAANPDARVSRRYDGRSDWLMLFGAGGEDRYPHWQAHRASGRRTIVWDLGYWDRQHMLRVSVDDLHPQRWIYRVPAIRGREYAGPLRDDYAVTGPVVFACMGTKSVAQHGKWDKLKIAALGPGVVVRPKPDRLTKAEIGPIAAALKGASKLVTHHSNSAIDAIIAGVPHDCVDGAAVALKPTRDPVLRRDFLDRLGSWQWAPDEAKACWAFLLGVPNV